MDEAAATSSFCPHFGNVFLVANRWQQTATNPCDSCYCSRRGMRSSWCTTPAWTCPSSHSKTREPHFKPPYYKCSPVLQSLCEEQTCNVTSLSEHPNMASSCNIVWKHFCPQKHIPHFIKAKSMRAQAKSPNPIRLWCWPWPWPWPWPRGSMHASMTGLAVLHSMLLRTECKIIPTFRCCKQIQERKTLQGMDGAREK